MKFFPFSKKTSFLAFSIVFIATTILVVIALPLTSISTDVETYSMTMPGRTPEAEEYEVPSIDPKAPMAPSVYPKSDSDVNLKVRKSLVDLTSDEKSRFVNAMRTIKETYPEGSDISIFDGLVLQHVMVAGFDKAFKSSGPAAGINPAHPGHPGFLPWHRKLLFDLETALQKVDASVTIPYWDWTDPRALDVMLSDDFMGGNGEGKTVEVSGIGTFEGGIVKSGPFADWTLNEDIHIEPINLSSLGPKILRFVQMAPFEKYPIPKEVIERVMNVDNYEIFSVVLEGGGVGLNEKGKLIPDWAIHVYAHALIGGLMLKDPTITALPENHLKVLGTNISILSAPYDPVFWLLHSNVDRLWAEWQDRGHTGESFYPAEGKQYGYNLNDPIWPWDGGASQPGNLNNTDLVSLLPKTDEVITAADMLDFRKLGYTYDSTRLRSEKPLLMIGNQN